MEAAADQKWVQVVISSFLMIHLERRNELSVLVHESPKNFSHISICDIHASLSLPAYLLLLKTI